MQLVLMRICYERVWLRMPANFPFAVQGTLFDLGQQLFSVFYMATTLYTFPSCHFFDSGLFHFGHYGGSFLSSQALVELR